MRLEKISCYYCKNLFYRRSNQVREVFKFSWKQYCSPNCLSRNRLRRVIITCAQCKKEISKTPSQLGKSQSSNHFCSSNCAAVFNNHARVSGRAQKFCANKDCQKFISFGNKYCSSACANSARTRSKNSLRKEVLTKIKEFAKINGRIPVKKEMYDAYGKARDAFGTWNKAIVAAGFAPNPVMFAKKYIARDGHPCDSMAEKIIDEWLFSKKIPHERATPYPELDRMTCDFKVGERLIEFFGLEGQHKRYTELVNKKRALAKKYKLNLVEIKPKDLFPKNRLNQVLNFLN